MTVAVVGIGLIGGSLMVDLRKRGFADKIILPFYAALSMKMKLSKTLLNKVI
jgi:prephenate dehydrogenase